MIYINYFFKYINEMGNNGAVAFNKIKYCIQGDPNALSYFEVQQKMEYSKQVGLKSLQHMIDIGDFGQYNSLKKVHRYLHPALKYLQYCQLLSKTDANFQQTTDANFIKIHEQQLISSAGNVLLMYYEYLRKVVPANISYFHFMRQKDFYIHYCALRYVLCAGQAGSLFKFSSKTIDLFNRLKIDNKLLYIKLISHWLYDMVKYRCSAIHIQSLTLPHLIVTNALTLCSLIQNSKINVLQEYERRQKNSAAKILIYQHCLYSFNYVLSEAHLDNQVRSKQGNGFVQVILLGIIDVVNSLWKDNRKLDNGLKSMYCPSYWYVQSIGFVKNPTLQTITFLLILDIIQKIKNPFQHFQHQPHKKMKQKIQKQASQSQFRDMKQYHDEIIQDNHKQSDDLNSKSRLHEDLMRGPVSEIWKYYPLNNITHIILYNCVTTILDYFPQFYQFTKLQQVLTKQIQDLSQNPFIRPYVLLIIKNLLNQGGINLGQHSKSYEGDSQRQKNIQNKLQVSPELVMYYKNNQTSYSTQNFIIPYETVGKNCSIYIKKIFPKVLQSYQKQITRQNGQIWGNILKYNQHQMQQITR